MERLLRAAWPRALACNRIAAASLVFRAAFLSGVLTARPARRLPSLITSLLEMGAPVVAPGQHASLQQAAMYALERPLTIELVERLLRWLVPPRRKKSR